MLKQFIYVVLIIAAHIISSMLLYKIISNLLSIRKQVIFKIITLGTFCMIFSVPIFPADFTNNLYTLIIWIIVTVVSYHGSILKKISTVMIFYPLVISINLMGFIYFYNNTFFRIIIFLILWFVMIKLLGDKLQSTFLYIATKELLIIDCISIAPLISIIVITYITSYNEIAFITLSACACLITNIGILILLTFLSQNAKSVLINQNNEMLQDYYKSLEAQQLEVRKLRHDINNYLNSLFTYMNSEGMESGKPYYHKLQEMASFETLKKYCSNSLLNAVINTKVQVITNSNIDFSIHIDIENNTFIDDIDLCALFSNSIDNAIEAVKKIEDENQRIIILKSRVINNYFSYQIENTKNNPIIKQNESLKTSKKNLFMHGLGLESIKDIVRKYSGSFDIQYSDERFCLTIIIDCNHQKKKPHFTGL